MTEDIKTCVYKQETADYYVAEWNNANSCGWLAKNLSERTGISISEALLFLSWMERHAHNNILREHTALLREMMPMQKQVLEHAVEEIKKDEADEDWRP